MTLLWQIGRELCAFLGYPTPGWWLGAGCALRRREATRARASGLVRLGPWRYARASGSARTEPARVEVADHGEEPQ